MRLNTVLTSCRRRQWNLSFVSCWISGDAEICEVWRLFADGFVCGGLHRDPILSDCWHDGSETVVLITLRATLSGSCPDSTASNAVHSDSQLLYKNPRRFPHRLGQSRNRLRRGVVPSRGCPVLNGIPQRQHAALVLQLVSDTSVLPDHTDHDVWRLGSADD